MILGKMQQWIVLIGRLLLGLSFLGAGIAKIGMWDALVLQTAKTPIQQAIGAEMIPVYLVFTILFETVGGLLVTLGAKTRLAALLLLLSMVFPLVFLDQFWNLSGAALTQAYTHFLLDIKIVGGILLLMAFGPGRLSVDRG